MFTSISGSLKKYADFSGRATRKEFWLFVLFLYITEFIAGFIDGMAGTEFVANIVLVGLLLPYISVAARRMHDVGKSGWFMLIPFYNLILAFTPSIPNPESNAEG